MSCERFRARLGEFLVGALEGEESAEALRHLETCAACGAEVAELERLEGSLAGLGAAQLVPAAPRRRFARRAALAAAAAVLVAAGILALATFRPAVPQLVEGRLRLVEAPGTEFVTGAVLPWGKLFTALERSRVAIGSEVAILAWPEARLEVRAPGEVHLASGDGYFEVMEGGGPFAVSTPLGKVRVEGTKFLVRVKEDGSVTNGTVVKAAAGGAVLVAVLAGAVTWIANSGSTAERIEAGQQATARAAAIEIESLAKVETIEKEKEALAVAKRDLEEEKRRLEEKVASLSTELGALKAETAANAPAGPGKPALSFGKFGDIEDLDTMAWKDAGAAAEKMSQLTKGILEKGIESLEDLQKDPVIMEFGTENMKLMPLALKMMGKVPTHAPVSANGAFTHPIVQWNLLAARLEHGGLPLNARQIGKINAIGAEFDGEWEELQSSYSAETLLLEKIVDELEIKKKYMDRIENLLTRKQRDAVIDPAIHHLYPWDVHSPALVVTAGVGAFGVEKKEGLREAAAERFLKHLDLKEGAIEASSPAFAEWAADVEGILTPVPKGMVQFMHLDVLVIAGRAQVKLMKTMLASGALSEEAKAKMANEGGILVPRLVETTAK